MRYFGMDLDMIIFNRNKLYVVDLVEVMEICHLCQRGDNVGTVQSV